MEFEENCANASISNYIQDDKSSKLRIQCLKLIFQTSYFLKFNV
nr:MAG TPA: hypothetical protein [Caudoviricetes sp.]DAU83705.1 MAG TPA: hypothetical protein [Caudoviricetes sp.]